MERSSCLHVSEWYWYLLRGVISVKFDAVFRRISVWSVRLALYRYGTHIR